jgi:hypothetical protein
MVAERRKPSGSVGRATGPEGLRPAATIMYDERYRKIQLQ